MGHAAAPLALSFQAGTTIELAPIHTDFICRKQGNPDHCGMPGGGFPGGEVELFDSVLHLQLTGTGEPWQAKLGGADMWRVMG